MLPSQGSITIDYTIWILPTSAIFVLEFPLTELRGGGIRVICFDYFWSFAFVAEAANSDSAADRIVGTSRSEDPARKHQMTRSARSVPGHMALS
jgi:hypothetical protein